MMMMMMLWGIIMYVAMCVRLISLLVNVWFLCTDREPYNSVRVLYKINTNKGVL